MRRVVLPVLLSIGLLVLSSRMLPVGLSSRVLAQASTSEAELPPPSAPLAPPVAAPAAADAVARAEAAAVSAQFYAAEASRYASDASNFLAIFEAISVGITIALGAVGLFGVTRLFSAQNALTATATEVKEELRLSRENLDKALEAKQQELDRLEVELRRLADEERHKSEQATLALSLMPLGERQYRVKDFEGALTSYEQALALDPHNMVIQYRLGYVNTQYGRLDEGMGYLLRALDLQPDFAPALATLGHIYRRKAEQLTVQDIRRGEMLAQAEQFLRQALVISPKLVDEDGESWWGSLGGLHRRRGQLDDAIECYTRAQEVTPQASYPLGNLALLYMQKNDRQRMMETYQRAERLAARRALVDVTDFWAWADLLVARLVLGKTTDLSDTLDSVFAATPRGAVDMLKSPLGTLRQLCQVLTPDEVARLSPVIERVETYIKAATETPVAAAS